MLFLRSDVAMVSPFLRTCVFSVVDSGAKNSYWCCCDDDILLSIVLSNYKYVSYYVTLLSAVSHVPVLLY